MLLAYFNRKEYLRHRAVSLRQHGFLVSVVVSQVCEILRKFELKAVQGHPRSSILVPIESALCNSSSSIVTNSNFGRKVFQILSYLARKIARFPHPTLVWHPSGGKLCDINVSYIAQKYIQCDTIQSLKVAYGSIFTRLAAGVSKICEILREFELIAGQGHPRSWCQSKVHFILVMNSNIGHISYRFPDTDV